MSRRQALAGLLALGLSIGLSSAPAAAHDFWLEPSTFHPHAVSTVRVGLRVGESSGGKAVRRSADHLERFVIAGPNGLRDVPGREGLDPAGLAPIRSAGTHVIGYQSQGSSITLPAARFEAYLEHEGLDRARRLRRERGETGEPGREVFFRSAKCLVFAGDGGTGADGGHDRRLGLALELVPERDPRRLAPGEPLGLRLFFRSRPVAAVRVGLRHRDRPAEVRVGRTDAQGRVSLALPGPGPWLATAVHMEPAANHGAADWESFWASLTFSGRATDADPSGPPAASVTAGGI